MAHKRDSHEPEPIGNEVHSCKNSHVRIACEAYTDFASTRLQVLKFRGAGKRITKKRVSPWGERPDEQTILYLYTEFAQFGDLEDVALAHADKNL